jgi:TetR/AcrR family transcriptional regulator, transcriptional repressor for nem operon
MVDGMGRPRGFDEAAVVQAAAELFATRSYDGISMDELVTHLGVHRNSLYKTFGSKRGLYQAALTWSLEHDIAPLIDRLAHAGDIAAALRVALTEPGAEVGLNLLLLAAVERAPVDSEVAEQLGKVLAAFDQATQEAANANAPADDADHTTPGTEADLAFALTATILGLRLRARAAESRAASGTDSTTNIHQASAALAHRLTPQA